MHHPPAIMQGYMLKRKRKRLQGMARRYFTLSEDGDLAYSVNATSKVRDCVHISQAMILATRKTRTITIDAPQAAVMHCRTLTLEDFDAWTSALQTFITTQNGRRVSRSLHGRHASLAGSLGRDQLESTTEAVKATIAAAQAEIAAVLPRLQALAAQEKLPAGSNAKFKLFNKRGSNGERAAEAPGGVAGAPGAESDVFNNLSSYSLTGSTSGQTLSMPTHLAPASPGATTFPPTSSASLSPAPRSRSNSALRPIAAAPSRNNSLLHAPSRSASILSLSSKASPGKSPAGKAVAPVSADTIRALQDAAAALQSQCDALSALQTQMAPRTAHSRTSSFYSVAGTTFDSDDDVFEDALQGEFVWAPGESEERVNAEDVWAEGDDDTSSDGGSAAAGGGYVAHSRSSGAATPRDPVTRGAMRAGVVAAGVAGIPGFAAGTTGTAAGTTGTASAASPVKGAEQPTAGAKGSTPTHGNSRPLHVDTGSRLATLPVQPGNRLETLPLSSPAASTVASTAASTPASTPDGTPAPTSVAHPATLASPAALTSLTSLAPPVRRTHLPTPVTTSEFSVMSILRKNVGKDLTSISFPVTMNEPLSLLQKTAEEFDAADLLSRGAAARSATEQLMFVSAFAITTYAGYKYRTSRKPFNPLLGETYECIRPERGFCFLAEKVSHHPPVIAFDCMALTGGWRSFGTLAPDQKFWGRSMEIFLTGEFCVAFGDRVFRITRPSCFVRNLMAGTKYLEVVGEMTIEDTQSGARAVVHFKEGSTFGGRASRNRIEGTVADAAGHSAMHISGRWDEEITIRRGSREERVWTYGDFVASPEYYGLSPFAMSLNEITSIDAGMAPTDSRRRPDQRQLEEGHVDVAEETKRKLEDKQRERRKAYEARHEAYTPAYFVPQGELWVDNGTYFEKRARGAFEPNALFDV